MKTRVIVSTRNDEDKFIGAIQEWLYGTKVYLDKEKNIVRRVSDEKEILPYRKKEWEITDV